MTLGSDTGQMRCGNCGHEKYNLFSVKEGLVVQCCKCDSASLITVSKPKLEMRWGTQEKDKGLPSVF